MFKPSFFKGDAGRRTYTNKTSQNYVCQEISVICHISSLPTSATDHLESFHGVGKNLSNHRAQNIEERQGLCIAWG
jgi:hypothetical protein